MCQDSEFEMEGLRYIYTGKHFLVISSRSNQYHFVGPGCLFQSSLTASTTGYIEKMYTSTHQEGCGGSIRVTVPTLEMYSMSQSDLANCVPVPGQELECRGAPGDENAASIPQLLTS